MVLCIIEQILLLLGNIVEEKQNSHVYHNEMEKILYEVQLPRIELDDNSLLMDIFQEIISDSSGQTMLYEVTMNDYYEGTIISINARNNNILNGSLYWNGYVLINGKKFVIARIYSDYSLPFAIPEQQELFNIARYDKTTYNQQASSWLFYILDKEFAVYSPKEGWIWSDGKPDQ